MRNLRRQLSCLLFLTGCLINAAPAMAANPFTSSIEAQSGKRYTLTKAHGPWMIMVASLADPPADRKKEGITAEEAADALVLELRQRGLPAYVVRQDSMLDSVNTVDRLGRKRERKYSAQQERVCVIAGNYQSIEDRTAQQSLEMLKKYKPRCWEGHAAYRSTPGRPGPLSGAFFTINPLLTPEEVSQRKRDPLLLKLNSGLQFSLFENPGRYSLIVASFYGRSRTVVGEGKFQQIVDSFKVKDSLDDAAEDAWKVANLLNNHPRLRERGVSAWVLHERYRSIVTVGAFDSPDDPLIPVLIEMFRAKVKMNPLTGKQVLVGENITAPNSDNPNLPQSSWTFDPDPTLIAVPKLTASR